MTRVLLVEDDSKLRASLVLLLRDEGFAVEGAASAEEALAATAARGLPELLLLDVRLPGRSGVELVRELVGSGRLPPTIVLSGEASVSETIEVLRLGVHDFLEKPFGKERLLQSMRNTLSAKALERRVAALESTLHEPKILGVSPAIDRLRAAIERVAASAGRVLVRGESGTGKELVAAELHARSSRRSGPFVKLNCAAIPAPLVEAELFGHARGAFTGAETARAGLFEAADRGTLFLDEIGDMELALQARLLRVLEDGRVRRVGETRERQVDVRLIAATHRDLEAEVAAGRLRQDLFFRLAHLPVEVPPLRERGGDVRLLFDHFVARFAARDRRSAPSALPAVYALLERYRWPGNVRELENFAERMVVFGSDPISPADLPAAFFGAQPEVETGLLRPAAARTTLTWREFKSASEREFLETVLRRTGWNFSAAARLLGLQRTYVHEKAAALGLERPQTEEEGS